MILGRLVRGAFVGTALALWPLATFGASSTPAAPPIVFGGPFELIDHNGERRTDRDFGDRYLLVFFGYTFCPDICPTDLQVMAGALDLLGAAAERVQPLFITVDPARDTPAVLKDYVAHFHPRILGLTGEEAAIRATAKAYRVHRRKVVPAGADAGEDYYVDHSSMIYFMAPDGDFVTLFPHGSDPAGIAAAIRRYLAGESG